MARRDYEMAFRLNAQMNSGFGGTFKAAQATLSEFQKKILEINRTQRDITAYERQQRAVDATQQKMQLLQQQYDNIQKEIQETEKYSSSLENRLLSKQAQIDKTSQALETQNQKLNEMGQSLREAGVDTQNMEASQKKLEEELEKTRKAQEEAAKKAEEYGRAGQEAVEAVSQALAAAGIVTALKEIAEAYMECVSVAGNFEETLSTVEALSGASGSQMAALSEEAKKLGAETQYTAQQSAEAMTYMAMAGWDTTDMLNGMDGVISLAASSGEDLAQVSDIVTDALTAFGLSASDTSHFADILAATATNANTSVGLMGETFKYAAPLAGALGYSAEDVATMIGLMANSGIKASQAGTALRKMFSSLTDGAELSSAAFGEVTIETQNSDGSMRGLSDTMADLRRYFAEMTEAEKLMNAENLVGERAMIGFITLMNSTQDDFDSLSASISNCSGSAARMADIKLDNMNGQLKLAQSAWEGVTIAVGEQFTPTMGKAYEIAAEVFGALKRFIEDHPAIVKAVVVFAAVMGTAVAAVTAYAAAAKIAAAASALLTASIPGLNMVMGIVAGVAALTAGMVALVSASGEGVESVASLTEAAKDMQEALDGADAVFEETRRQTAASADVASYYVGRLEEIEAATGGNVKENQEYHNILELLTRQIPELADYIDLTTDSIEGGTEALRQHIEAWKADAEQVAQQEYMNSLYDEYSAVLTEAAENEIKLTEAQIKERMATEGMHAAQERMNELWQEAQKKADEYYKEYGGYADAADFLSGEYYDLQNSLYEYDNEIYTAQKNQKNLAKAIEKDAEATAAAEEAISGAEAALAEMNAEQTAAEAAAAELAEEQLMLSDRIAETTSSVDGLMEAYNEAYDAAAESVIGQYGLWDQAADQAATKASDINAAIESQIQYWEDYNANLAALSEREGDIAGLSDVIASFADGSEESVNAIAGMAEASDEDLQKMVENYTSLIAQQDEVSASIADMKTDFTEQMNALGEELAADIEAMNLSDEASASGAATIQGYIDGLNSRSTAAYTAASNLAKQVNAALGMPGTGRAAVSSAKSGYASGTEAAAPGFHMVGENGPEMVFFRGGEQVLNAAETVKAKEALSASPEWGESGSAGGGTVTYAPSITLSGTSVTEDRVREILADEQEKFERMWESYMHRQSRLSFA